MRGWLQLLAWSTAFLGAGCGGGGGGGGGGPPPAPALAALSVSHGALAPAFAPGTTAYTVGPLVLPTSVTVTPTVAHAGETVTVGGTAVVSGNASGQIVLGMGVTVVAIVVTSSDAVTTREYTVSFDRTSAELSGLTTSVGAVAPAFFPAVTSYSVGPPIVVDSSTLTATAADPAATVTVKGDVVTSGTPSLPFAVTADLTTVTVVVTARDGSTKTYDVVFDRIDALFFDDFSAATLDDSWSGTGSLDAGAGVPAPSLALLTDESVEYVGDAVLSTPGVTLTVDVQRDPDNRARIRLFDSANPTQRWLSFEMYQNTLQTEYRNAGAFVIGSQGPIPADDHLFHRVVIQIDATGTVFMKLDGVLYMQFNISLPATNLRFTLSHPTDAPVPGTHCRFDDVTWTSP